MAARLSASLSAGIMHLPAALHSKPVRPFCIRQPSDRKGAAYRSGSEDGYFARDQAAVPAD
jgi:hypothetical protein